MVTIEKYAVPVRSDYLASVIPTGVVSVVDHLGSQFLGFRLQVVSQMPVLLACLVEFEGLDVLLDDPVGVHHSPRIVGLGCWLKCAFR